MFFFSFNALVLLFCWNSWRQLPWVMFLFSIFVRFFARNIFTHNRRHNRIQILRWWRVLFLWRIKIFRLYFMFRRSARRKYGPKNVGEALSILWTLEWWWGRNTLIWRWIFFIEGFFNTLVLWFHFIWLIFYLKFHRFCKLWKLDVDTERHRGVGYLRFDWWDLEIFFWNEFQVVEDICDLMFGFTYLFIFIFILFLILWATSFSFKTRNISYLVSTARAETFILLFFMKTCLTSVLFFLFNSFWIVPSFFWIISRALKRLFITKHLNLITQRILSKNFAPINLKIISSSSSFFPQKLKPLNFLLILNGFIFIDPGC